MNKKITLLYIYRNLDLLRVERSLNSLTTQTNKIFDIVFVDYGSDIKFSNEVKKLLENYKKVKYVFADTRLLPWNRSHAINIGILNTTTDYFFTSDVDMLYADNFIETLYKIKKINQVTSLIVAYLSKKNYNWDDIAKYKILNFSKENATGMSLFYKQNVIDCGLFDEKYIYWGGEDNDILRRLKAIGVKAVMHNQINLAFHQWHEKFKNNLDSFPLAIDKYLFGDSKQIFQNKRKRGKLLYFDYSSFYLFKINGEKYLLSQKLNDFVFSSAEKNISVEVLIKKRDNKYTRGKTVILKNILNKYFRNYSLKIDWIKTKPNFLFRREIKPLVFNFLLSNYDRVDLVGVLEKENSIVFYFSK